MFLATSIGSTFARLQQKRHNGNEERAKFSSNEIVIDAYILQQMKEVVRPVLKKSNIYRVKLVSD